MRIKFLTEDGESADVKFDITESPASNGKRFGISAVMTIDGVVEESEIAAERFFTRKEAERTMAMLCEYKVTPCTLCDII